MFSINAHNLFAKFTVATLIALLLIQSLSAPLLAQNRSTNRTIQDDSVMVNPLAKNDPRAQLNPELLSAEPMPARNQQEDSFAGQEPTVVEYDLRSGQETRSSGQSLQADAEVAPHSGFAGPRQMAENLESNAGAQLDNYLCIDDKQAVHNTWQYPWSTQVKLFMRFPNNGTYVGSGTMIGSKYVITHQNNVYYPAFGGLATSIEVVPGLDGYYKPFGSAYATYLRYYYHGSANLGLITLDRHIGYSTGWLGYSSFANAAGFFSDATLNAGTGNIAGYPVSKDYGCVLYYDCGAADVLSYDQARVGVLWLSGEMGAGAYLKNSYGDRYVFGVSASAYYCSTNVDRLTSWIHGQFNYVISNGL